jgi:hypothetical protein
MRYIDPTTRTGFIVVVMDSIPNVQVFVSQPVANDVLAQLLRGQLPVLDAFHFTLRIGSHPASATFSGGGGVIVALGGTHPNLRHVACTSAPRW